MERSSAISSHACAANTPRLAFRVPARCRGAARPGDPAPFPGCSLGGRAHELHVFAGEGLGFDIATKEVTSGETVFERYMSESTATSRL
ncbi:MAG: hypothetical protein VX246_07780 [Myxococcota bacterium]|nr:hypothetical protein [Myxococcota bacterium]